MHPNFFLKAPKWIYKSAFLNSLLQYFILFHYKDIKRGNFKHQNGYIVELPAGNAHKIYGRLRSSLPSSQRTEFVPLKFVKNTFKIVYQIVLQN